MKKVCIKNIKKDEPLLFNCVESMHNDKIINKIIKQSIFTKKAKITVHSQDGRNIMPLWIKNFFNNGAIIIDKINREYCKKLLILLPGQYHPVHFHPQKEETFELLHGDCSIKLKDEEIHLEHGLQLLIKKEHLIRSKAKMVQS